jgi:hypothetical protein
MAKAASGKKEPGEKAATAGEADTTMTPSAKELLRKIRDAAVSLSVVGMVDDLDTDDGGIKFTTDPGCGRWVEVPTRMIDKLEFLQTVRCRDHAHPLVRLTLKEPKSPDAKVFAALAANMATSPAMSAEEALRPVRKSNNRMLSMESTARSIAPCEWVWDAARQDWVCVKY